MLEKAIAKRKEGLQDHIKEALLQGAKNNAGVRVEIYFGRSVIVITDTVPAGTVEYAPHHDNTEQTDTEDDT